MQRSNIKHFKITMQIQELMQTFSPAFGERRWRGDSRIRSYFAMIFSL